MEVCELYRTSSANVLSVIVLFHLYRVRLFIGQIQGMSSARIVRLLFWELPWYHMKSYRLYSVFYFYFLNIQTLGRHSAKNLRFFHGEIFERFKHVYLVACPFYLLLRLCWSINWYKKMKLTAYFINEGRWQTLKVRTNISYTYF